MSVLHRAGFFGFIFFCSFWASGIPDVSAQITVKGRILDAATLLPVEGAAVAAKNYPQVGTASDSMGYFELNLPEAVSRLIIRHIAYTTVILPPETGEDIEILLTPRSLSPEESITVTASRIPVSLSLAAPVVEVPRTLLLRDQDLSIAPVLNRIPGIFMHSGALNTNRITIRGIGSRSPFATAKIKAYLNDIPLTSGVGETTLEDIDLSLISRAQVWKGPSASTYGAGLGGVLLFELDDGSRDTVSAFSQKFTTGSFGLQRYQASLKVADPDSRLKIHLNYNRTHLDGYRENSRYDRSGLALAAHWDWEDSELTVFLNGIALKSFIPSSLSAKDFNENPEKAAFIWAAVKGFEDYDKRNIGLNYRKSWEMPGGNRLDWSSAAFSGTYGAYESRPFNILRENSRISGLRNTLEWKNSNRPGFSLKGGLEWFEENYDWQTNRTIAGAMDTLLSDDSERRTYANLFAETERRYGPWKFSLGLNYNQTAYRLADRFPSNGDQSGRYAFDPVWSPRLGIRYSLSDRIALFGVASHGFSAPTLEETLNPDGQVNPDIRPERGWNMELGVRGIQWREAWSFDVSAFNMEIRDLLVAERTNFDQFVGKNAGRTRHSGLEFFLQYSAPWSQHQLDIGMGYTLADYRFREFIDRDVDYSGKSLPGIAPHVANILLDWATPFGVFLNASYQWVDAMPLRDGNEAYSERYQLLHVKLGWIGQLSKHFSLEMSGGIQNLLDEHYASMILVNAAGATPRYYYPGTPRNAFGSLLLRWNW